jgi:hypothetical protein
VKEATRAGIGAVAREAGAGATGNPGKEQNLSKLGRKAEARMQER